MTVSRRAFTKFLGAGAAVATFPQVLAKTATAAPILLNSNENPYGPSPAALQAMRDAMAESFRYPDDAEVALGEAVAHMHGVTTSEVLLANGSSDVLRLAAAAFLPGGKKLVTAVPTFESLWSHARGNEIVRVPLDAKHAHDLEKMAEAARGASLVYLCNPNNPTATITPKAAVRAFLDAVPTETIVLVDEAYHHYVESGDYESVIPLVAKKQNLVVARTFSKIYAMAGLRCGYAIAQKPLVDKMLAHQAYNAMNLMACVAARASLLDSEHAVASKKKNRETRAWLFGELEGLGFPTLPSEANFFMVDVRKEVRPVIDAFRDRGVRIGRRFPAMPQYLRVTLGTREEMQRFLEVFREVVI
ncbi:MAG TPA: aminotransferase class I/II-fold pyridoxal phosphate-dependent enzyme [Thermoanaerobaculia bacterium]|jgi:histidinol-phosphate aminotransferase|nr:aminotransferase class I/II-fold pyridoxal phosphate-dependent enzyme [Thermoanaerobaculia bacterium]